MSDAPTARHDIEENPLPIGAWTSRTQFTVSRKLANSSVGGKISSTGVSITSWEGWRAVVPPTFAKPLLTCRDPSCFCECAVVFFAIGTFERVCLAATWFLRAALLSMRHLLTTTRFRLLCCVGECVATSDGAHDQRLQHRLLNWLRTCPQRGSMHQ